MTMLRGRGNQKTIDDKKKRKIISYVVPIAGVILDTISTELLATTNKQEATH